MTSSPITLKNRISPVQKVDLPKIDKLLDKLQRNVHKCQDDDYFDESEKYVSHIEKTSELCSLVWQEIIGTLEMSASTQCIRTLDKLFKVMRLQTMSTLNFGLHYYKQYSEALLDQEKNGSLSPKTHHTIPDFDQISPGKPQGTFESRIQVNETFDNLEGRGSVQSTSPVNRRQPYHRGGPNYPVFTVNGGVPAGKAMTMQPVMSSQAKSLTNFKYTFGAQLNKTDRDFSPEALAVSDNRYNQLNSMQEMLENMPTEEQDQNMLKEYYDEHDKMQQQIDEVLKGKTKVANLTPNNVTINLRQVLRNLDSTQKQITQITTDTKNNTIDDDDSDDMEEPNFAEMGTKIKNAFQQAKLKAQANMKGVLKSNSNSPALKKKGETVGKGGKSVHSKNKSKGGAAAEQILPAKKDVSTYVDELEFIMEEQAVLVNENKKNQQKSEADEKEEKNKLLINSLKIKIGQLEKEKNDKGDKYSKLINDYATCAQEKRDAWEKIKQLEKEIEELRALLKQQKVMLNEKDHQIEHLQNMPVTMTIAEAKIPIAQTHDHSERSPVTAKQFNALNVDSRDEIYGTTSKGTANRQNNQEWDHVRGGASEIFSNSAKHEAHGESDSHGTSNPPSVRHIGGAGSSSSNGANNGNNIKSLQDTEKNASSPQKVVQGRIPSKSLHSSTVKSNFKPSQSNHDSPINEHPGYLEVPAISEAVNSNDSNISENQKRSLERMINEPYRLEDLQEDFSADVEAPRRPDYVKGDTDNENTESQQTLSIEERPELTEIIHPVHVGPGKLSTTAPIFIESKEEKKEELVNAIRDSISLVAIKAQESAEVMENNSSVSLGPGPKSLSQSRLQTPSQITSITSPTQARRRIDVIVKTEVGDRSKRPSPDRKTTKNHTVEGSPETHHTSTGGNNKKALSINNFEKAHVRPSNQKSSKLIPPAAVTQTKMATIFSAATEKSQVSETISPGMFSVDEESSAARAKKFMNEGEISEPPRIKREHRREKSLADYTPNKMSILQSFDFQEDVSGNKLESPSKGRILTKRNTELQHNRPAKITTQQPSKAQKPPQESGIRSPAENYRSPTENLKRALEEEDNSVSYTSPNLILNNSNESISNNTNYRPHVAATANHSNHSHNNTSHNGNTRALGKSSTLVYLRTADSPTHQNRPKPGLVLSNNSLVNLHSISKTNIKSPTYVQEYVQSKTPSIAKKIWQEVEEVKNFPANGILYKGRSKFPTAVPMTYDSAEDRGHAESSPNRYMYSTSRGIEDEVIGNNTDPRSFPITISNYSPKNSNMHLNDFSSGFNTTTDKFMKPKLTIEECLRQEMNKEKESPAHNREDGQIRIMYRSMLAKAKQDPKLIQYIRRLVEIEGEDLSVSEHPIVEFTAFARFVNRYVNFHEKCGQNCEHVVKFYAKIGYQVYWNKRAPMPIKRAEIGVRNDTGRNSPRFPSIGKKKKELVLKDIYH